jgi:GT2 family glycosyltransferase
LPTVAADPPLFSVIVLNWNGRHLIEECLDTVLSQTYRDFETIVVDNGSSDDSVAWLRERRAGAVRLVPLPSNLGFAGGNNAGIRASLGRYVVLLNNDTAVDPRWLEELAAAFGRHPDAGMFTPKILNYHRRDEIDNTGHLIYPDGLARGRHRLERDDGRFDEEGETLWPSGCAGVYKKEMLDEVGLLDDSFFAYGEDVDLGLRARWAGWTCWYVPRAVVYHKYSATTGTYSPRKAFLAERNRTWVLLKNFPPREIALSFFHTLRRYLLQAQGAATGRGAAGKLAREIPAWRIAWTVLSAEASALGGLSRILKKRREIARSRRIPVSEFRALLHRHAMSAVEVSLKD